MGFTRPQTSGGDVVSDTTPQLGGDLDLNGHAIDFPSVANVTDCLDEDNMASNSNTKLATQQSIKAYVDSQIAGLGGDMVAAIYDPTSVEGDAFDMDNMVEGADTKILTAAERAAIATNSAKVSYTDAAKVAGIESGADVTDSANVAAAGAHMAGGTDVPVTDGGTGASDAAGAKTNLGFMTDVVDDTTPQLGGPLDTNGKTIAGAENNEGNTSTALTIDWTIGNIAKCLWTDNVTFTFTPPANPCILHLRLLNDGTGSHTVDWPAEVKWNAGVEPTWTTVADEVNIATFYYDGANYYGDGWTES